MPLAALALGLAGVAGVISYTGNGPDALGVAIVHGLAVLVPIAVGLLIWVRAPAQPFGPLLVAAGVLTFPATLGGSDQAVLYSIGRVAAWPAEVMVIFLILAFPSGRLRDRTDRAVMRLVIGVLVILFLPTAFLVDDYPVPGIWTACVQSCPRNAFQVIDAEPGWVSGVVIPLREALVTLILLTVAGRLLVRIGRATTIARRTLTPVLVGATINAVALPAAFAVRHADRSSDSSVALAASISTGLALLALGVLVGMWRARVAIGERLSRLAPMLQRHPDPATLREVLADTLQDPSVEFVYRTGEHAWLDMDGRPARLPRDGSGRAHTVVFDGESAVAAIIHDKALMSQQEFVRAAGGLAMVAFANHRLSAEVETSLEELGRSRRRIIAVADAERRRIERDLHDGAQQRLVALRIQLELASELSAARRLPDAEKLHELSQDVSEALDDVRALAAGVYPALLVDGGLGEALRSVARRSATPVRVSTQGLRRYSTEIEAAVYFCCVEALQNAAKHAEAQTVCIALSDTGQLRFEVHDDGRGFDMQHHEAGHGLMNIRDRLVAVGGELLVESEPGKGTRIAGVIAHPCAAAAAE
jgi:signal transduction histidine kinase